MMGINHAACGMAAWVFVATRAHVPEQLRPWWEAAGGTWRPDLPLTWGILDVGPAGTALGALVCAGAALLPDIDHTQATIARSLSPLSQWMAKVASSLSGGHRQGTHSLLGVAVFVALAFLASLLSFPYDVPGIGTKDISVGAFVVSLPLVAFALTALKLQKPLRRHPWLFSIPLSLAAAVYGPPDASWIVWATGIGVVAHILGDLLTTGGCPLLWPYKPKPPKVITKTPLVRSLWKKNGFLSVPLLGKTGSGREWLLSFPVTLYGFAGIGVSWAQFAPTLL